MSHLQLYSMPSSGNSYKVRLLLALTGQDYEHIPCEANSTELSEAKAAGHLPLGKLPALHLPSKEVLSESGAILWYLARETAFLPNDPLIQSEILSWMFFEQNRMEPVIAVRASLNCYPHLKDQATPERMADLQDQGHALLQLLENRLSKQDWLAGSEPTIADIALFGYVHSSGSRGGYDMTRFPAINNWCQAIKDLPGYISLEHQP